MEVFVARQPLFTKKKKTYAFEPNPARTRGNCTCLSFFKLIDAMLDNPMDYLVKQLPLSENVADAMIHGTGRLDR